MRGSAMVYIYGVGSTAQIMQETCGVVTSAFIRRLIVSLHLQVKGTVDMDARLGHSRARRVLSPVPCSTSLKAGGHFNLAVIAVTVLALLTWSCLFSTLCPSLCKGLQDAWSSQRSARRCPT